MGRVAQVRGDVKLLFPGTRHPNARVSRDATLRRTVELARESGLLDRAVFFGDWVPYDSWPNFLLEADVALSLHHDTAETRLAFRSRVLDYIWAGLPMVVTRGDALSEFVSAHGLGRVIDYGAEGELVDALLELLQWPRGQLAARFEEARQALTWEKAAEPLVAFLKHPRRAADRGAEPILSLDASRWREKAAGCAVELEEMQRRVSSLGEANARLQNLVAGYEQGRFIRLMKWLHDRHVLGILQ
jgi:hypothetical protein